MNKYSMLMVCGLVTGLMLLVIWLERENSRQHAQIVSYSSDISDLQAELDATRRELLKQKETEKTATAPTQKWETARKER